MIVLCAWCIEQDRPAFLRELPPYVDSRVSHGICPGHAAEWRAKLRAQALAAEAHAGGGGILPPSDGARP